ncbi:chaperone modulator CbpM [Marinimicrobium agarilyticum]|uniref:chaperone modulator CbpM n=1 Tax=Marinimicrobium agarilyticum TaxID=306546 RepID=UPI0003F8DDD7|nr:chaperone modulator CbpM [Marinimicrobium agarilyticum]
MNSLTGTILEEDIELTLGELCRNCHVEVDFVVELVQEGVIDPLEPDASRWAFAGHNLVRLRRAVNLHRDLGINLAGIALVLDLLEESERLKTELARWRSPS